MFSEDFSEEGKLGCHLQNRWQEDTSLLGTSNYVKIKRSESQLYVKSKSENIFNFLLLSVLVL